MRKIDKIIVHCADTYADMNVGAHEIRKWHLARGFNDIGYHFVIRRDGVVEEGRALDKMGAHCAGQNTNSIGICLVGGKGKDNKAEDNFTDAQREKLKELLEELQKKFACKVYGHCDFNKSKTCPVLKIS